MSKPKLTLAQKVANLNTPLTWENIENKPPFGTEANTILEGSKFIEGLGVNGYGGTIQDPGQKVAGKCYFDINTKLLFLCKTTNNLTSPNSDYFTSFDNKSLLNKLENLFNIKEDKTKLSFNEINNINLDNIRKSGFYSSGGWSNNISGLPAEISDSTSRAFYLIVLALSSDSYCQQILYSFKGIIYYRAITGYNLNYTQWRKII